jgi:glutathione synthase/RimK-type ligase-like ATP-grasp enzyme
VTDCTLVTCDDLPALDPDDRVMVDELQSRGLEVSVGVWSDPNFDWSATRLCILRSTWDYHARYRDFDAWVRRADALTTIRNDTHLLQWSAHKSYLRELERDGVPIVPTAWLPRGQNRDLVELSEMRGWGDLVVKPARGAAAHDVMLVRQEPDALSRGQAHLSRLLRAQDVLVQPYLDRIDTYGERALVFFEGRYSHAVLKKPFDTVLAIRGDASAVVEPTDEELDVAMRAMTALPGHALYARVDLLRDGGGNPCVSEVELIEPALYLAVHRPARVIFANAIERELEAIVKRSALHPIRIGEVQL